MNSKPDALKTQIGGGHYQQMAIQPMEFSMTNNWDACAHTILKYISRHASKNGLEDLNKARHCVDMRVELMDGVDLFTVSVRIPMAQYLKENQIGIFEAAALKALEAWVWGGTERCRMELLVAIDTLIKKYDPAPTFGSLGSWPGDRLKTSRTPSEKYKG